MTPQLLGDPRVGVRVLAEREQSFFARSAVSARDRKWDDYAITRREILDMRAYLDHFAHELVPEYIAALHGRDEPVVEVKVRATDRGRRDADDGIPRVENFGIWNRLDLDALLPHPAVGFHRGTFLGFDGDRLGRAG